MRIAWRPYDRSRLDLATVFALVFALLGTAGVIRLWLPLPLPPCLFHRITHLPCPSCGSTRAALALLRLDLAQAFAWNPLAAAIAIGCAIFTAWAFVSRLFSLASPAVELEPRDRLPLGIALALAIAANWAYLVWAGV